MVYVLERVMSFLNVADIAIMSGTNSYFYRELTSNRYFVRLNFECIPVPLPTTIISSRIVNAGNALESVVLPKYIKYSDYKK